MIGLGCDSAGFTLMQDIKGYLDSRGIAYKDFGAYTTESSDYPLFAQKAAAAVLSGECDRAILICGTGNGISMAANRYNGIRCALCHDVFSVKAARSHNDANILAMGGRVIGKGLALEIVEAWLATDFSNEERHSRRIKQIDEPHSSK